MYLHASDIAAFMRCPRLAKLNLAGKNEISRLGNMEAWSLGWQSLFENLAPLKGHTGMNPELSLQAVKEKKAGINLRFEAFGIRTKIPVLLPNPDGTWNVIYPVVSSAPKNHMLETWAINRKILQSLGITIKKHFVLYADKDYVHHTDSDLKSMYQISERLYKSSSSKYKETIDMQLDALEKETDLMQVIETASAVLKEEQLPEAVRCKSCTAGRKCLYYEDCFHQAELLDDSVEFLSGLSTKAREKNIGNLASVSSKDMDGQPYQFAQIQAARNGGRFIDRAAVKAWMESLVYPVSYLDFEWDTLAAPEYENMQPLQALCFEASLHIEEKDGTIRHYSFFDGDDGREKLIQFLLSKIPASGSILVFNMEGGEKLRLQELAVQFPKYAKELDALCERMVDLAVPFEHGYFYDLAQRGRYSLKVLEQIFSGSSAYADLDVHDGLEAVGAYRKYLRSEDALEKEQIQKEIDTYCAQDTWSEKVILDALKDIVYDESIPIALKQ